MAEYRYNILNIFMKLLFGQSSNSVSPIIATWYNLSVVWHIPLLFVGKVGY